MTIYKLNSEDKVKNSINLYPRKHFYIYDSVVHHNTTFPSSSVIGDTYLYKNGEGEFFSSVTETDYAGNFSYGDKVAGNSISQFTSSLKRDLFTSSVRSKVEALKNSYDYYTSLSPHYKYSSSLGNKETQDLNLIQVPSIFYGTKIKKGTVDLRFYISGSLIGQLKDEKNNGELIQVGPSGSTGSGSVAGVCLYNEGIISLTGSWNLESTTRQYLKGGSSDEGSWLYYGAGISKDFPTSQLPSASFEMGFKSSYKVPTVTWFCKAPRGELNHSNNPTYIKYGQTVTSSFDKKLYRENSEIEIQNVVSASYSEVAASFEKITFISDINLYDKDKNLIAVAKTSKPVKKTLDRDLTFKLTLDL